MVRRQSGAPTELALQVLDTTGIKLLSHPQCSLVLNETVNIQVSQMQMCYARTLFSVQRFQITLHCMLWRNRQPHLYPQTSADSFSISSPRPPNIQLLPVGLSSCCINSLWLITEGNSVPLGLDSMNGCVKLVMTLAPEMLEGNDTQDSNGKPIVCSCIWLSLVLLDM